MLALTAAALALLPFQLPADVARRGKGATPDYKDDAALLAGHRDKAQQYLLYTGAGRMEKQDFGLGADMALPICGEDGIKPDDMAVVEFGIAEPVYVVHIELGMPRGMGAVVRMLARASPGDTWLTLYEESSLRGLRHAKLRRR